MKFPKFGSVWYFLSVPIWQPLAEVLVVVEKIWKLALAVDDVASVADRVSQGSRPAAEHTNLADLKLEHNIAIDTAK